MAVLAPPVQVVASGAPPFVQVPSGAPPFVVTTGPAPPIQIVASGAPPITLFNADGSIWSAHTPAGGEVLLVGETHGFATDFLHPVDAERVALKSSGSTLAYAVDAFFTQAGTSPKMVYDASGVLGWSPHNLMLQSQTFDVGPPPWARNALTVTVNAIAAPDGTMTADAFTPPAGAVSPYTNQAPAVTSGTVVTISVYAKNGTLTPWLAIQSDTSAWFNLATGVKGTTSGGAISSNMVAVGNGWYRCDMTFTAASATPQVYLAMAIADGGGASCRTGDGVKIGFYLWGAQMNRGTVPTAYLPTTTAARFGLALDYDPATHAAKGLLCEPQGTNMHVQSNDLSALVFNNATITVNNQTGPDGAATADTFTEDTATSTHGGYGSASTVAAADYTMSRYIKMGTRRYAMLSISDSTNGSYAVYDLQSGVVGSSAAIGAGTLNSASIQACPNGWYRCILSGKNMGATVYYMAAAANAASYTPVDGHGRQSYTGTSSTLFWGHAQLEAGTVATSPIPTLGATVTRAADQPTVTPASINYSATAGSWWIYADMLSFKTQGRLIGNVSTGYTPIYVDTASVFSLFDGNIVSKTVTSVTGSHKVAAAFASADRALTADGLAPGTNTAAGTVLLSPGTAIGIGTDTNGANHCYVRQVRYLPRRPTNAELQTMTATVPYTGTIASQVMVTAAAASTGASASFTPPANSTLVAFVSARGGSSATATSLTDSLGSVWVKIGDYLGPNATAFVVTGVYTLAIGPSPVAMTVTGGSTVTGTSMGSGCQVISCTGSIGPLSNTQAGQSGVGSVSLTVSGVSVLTYYVRQTTASTIVIPTGYTELGGAHIQYNNMTASVAYDLTSPGNQNWTGGGNAIAWSGEISG